MVDMGRSSEHGVCGVHKQGQGLPWAYLGENNGICLPEKSFIIVFCSSFNELTFPGIKKEKLNPVLDIVAYEPKMSGQGMM